MTTDNRHSDILIAGAGAAGLVAAIALARAGFSVTCAGRSETKPNGRTVALFEGSLRVLKAIGLWPSLAGMAQPIEAIRLIDATGTRWPAPPLTLAARDVGLDALGANIENDRLVSGLLAEARRTPRLHLTGDVLSDLKVEGESVTGWDGDGAISAKLLVGADGRQSLARKAAGIRLRRWNYAQIALTATLGHEKPHGSLSTEFHTRAGPCTLVPLAGTNAHPHRSSLVWLMTPADNERRRSLTDADLAAELEDQTRSLVGRIQLEEARGHFPISGLRVSRLVAQRTALIGEAAHAFPPLAAQGLNLSIRDVAHLLTALALQRERSGDPGAQAALSAYQQSRRRDISIRTDSVDVLNRSIMTDFLPVDAARSAGATILKMVGPLRRAVLREGILAPCPDLRRIYDRPASRSVPKPTAA